MKKLCSNCFKPCEGEYCPFCGHKQDTLTSEKPGSDLKGSMPRKKQKKNVSFAVVALSVVLIGLFTAVAVTVFMRQPNDSGTASNKASKSKRISNVSHNGITYQPEADAYWVFLGEPDIEKAEIEPAINGLPVTGIEKSAFSLCSKLTSVTIPDSFKSISKLAFSQCESLTSVTMPDSILKIGDEAFSECTSLESIKIPDGVREIGDSAFYFCKSLKSITIPDSVTKIGDEAFFLCNLTEVSVPRGCDVDKDAFDKDVKITYR